MVRERRTKREVQKGVRHIVYVGWRDFLFTCLNRRETQLKYVKRFFESRKDYLNIEIYKNNFYKGKSMVIKIRVIPFKSLRRKIRKSPSSKNMYIKVQGPREILLLENVVQHH